MTRLTHDKTRFSKGAVNLKVLKPLPHSSQMPKDQHIGHRNLFKNTSAHPFLWLNFVFLHRGMWSAVTTVLHAHDSLQQHQPWQYLCCCNLIEWKGKLEGVTFFSKCCFSISQQSDFAETTWTIQMLANGFSPLQPIQELSNLENVLLLSSVRLGFPHIRQRKGY